MTPAGSWASSAAFCGALGVAQSTNPDRPGHWRLMQAHPIPVTVGLAKTPMTRRHLNPAICCVVLALTALFAAAGVAAQQPEKSQPEWQKPAAQQPDQPALQQQ